jgi:hypothetical protein
MATTWIHRAFACDLLVQFPDYINFRDSWNFGVEYLKSVSKNDPAQYQINPFNPHFVGIQKGEIGSTTSEQVSCYLGLDAPEPIPTGESWSPSGYAAVSPAEAIALGRRGEPQGFIPYESEGIWTRETRTAEEMDLELDWYKRDGELIEEQERFGAMWREIERLQLQADLNENQDLFDEPCTAGLRTGICNCCGEFTK